MTESVSRILEELIHNFLRDEEFAPLSAESHPSWQTIRGQGSELWLDTGDLDEATEQWTADFSGLTTNNSLLNAEVQSGVYDETITHAHQRLQDVVSPETDIVREIGYLLNVLHGKRLANRFDCQVSVELHTDLARDFEKTVEVGQRLYQFDPDHFLIKVPFTVEGILAGRTLQEQGIPVNQTVAFSVRQNYVIARLTRAAYGNVFMGRLNSLFQENPLPDIKRVGEKITLASQKTLEFLRQQGETSTRQIGASFRGGDQVMNMGGVDVLTIPPGVAAEYIELAGEKQTTGRLRLDTLLEEAEEKPGDFLPKLCMVGDGLRRAVDGLVDEPLDSMSPSYVRAHFREYGVEDLLPEWSEEDIKKSREEGKIPVLSNWEDQLKEATVSLDSLLSLAGLNAFAKAQEQMDGRIREKIKG